MKSSILVVAAIASLTTGAAYAQSDKPMMKPEHGPSNTDKSTSDAGIARDPGEVKAQQGSASKASPGTVGAAPGADVKSQGK